MSINLKNIVSRQIPEFAREDYPLFVAFIEAYYDYLSQQEGRNINELRDIDQTLDEYVQFFKNELDVFGDNYEFINEKLLLRKVKQLFIAKGVESSYKFLIKLLFNKTADISYPWNSVLKASDGKWQQEMSLFVNVATGSPTILSGNRIDIIGPNLTIKAYVERVSYIEDNVWEVFINKNYYGNIQVGYTISYGGVTGEILPTTVSYTVVKGGSNYKVGQLIYGNTIANGKVVTQLLKVTRVDDNGAVMNVTTLRFGYNYDTNFYLLKSNTPISVSSLLTINRDAVQQYSIQNDSKVDQYTDYGYILSPNYVDLDFTDPSYAATFLQQFYDESLSGQGLNPDYLLIRFDIGAVAKYQGHYNSNDGFVDDDIFIQDSFRWQKYSYLITVNEKLEKYKSLIKSYIHPAGTALFGEYQIQNTYSPGITASLELGTWTSLATFTVINKDIANDYVFPSDLGGQIRIEAYDLQDYFAPEELYNPPVSISFFGDGRNNLTSTNITMSDASPSVVTS